MGALSSVNNQTTNNDDTVVNNFIQMVQGSDGGYQIAPRPDPKAINGVDFDADTGADADTSEQEDEPRH